MNTLTINSLPQTKPSINSQIINITPELADNLLSRNDMNRNLKPHHVQTYAELMRNNNFQSLNGQTISISGSLTSGKLLDGQHRLTALIEANVTLPFLVVTGLPMDVFTTIDIGAKRTVGDMFDIKQVPYGRRIAPLIAFYARLRSRTENQKSRKVDGALVAYRLSSDDIYKLYASMKEDADELNKISIEYWEPFRIIGPSLIGGMMLYTRMHSIYRDRAENEFWKGLFTGKEADGMVLVCRNLLVAELSKTKDKRSSPTVLVDCIIKAYNTYFNTPDKIIRQSSLMSSSRIDKHFIFS